MIDTGDWELAELAEEEMRRKARKRNAVFRQRMEEHKRMQRELLKLRLAIAAALVAWTVVWIRCW
jgi:hypothetical protein